MAIDLTTLARVKAMGGWDVGDTTPDAVLSALITAYSYEFEAYMGRHTEQTSRTEVMRLFRQRRLVSARGAPFTVTPTSFKYGAHRDFSAETALTENTDYTVDLEQGTVLFLFSTVLEPGFVEIQYTGGMAADTAGLITAFPAVAEACDVQVIYHWTRRTSAGGNIDVTGGGTNFAQGELGLISGVKRTLDTYKRRRL